MTIQHFYSPDLNTGRSRDVSLIFFSVVSRSAFPTIKNRVIVEHVGDNTGSGTWNCYKDADAEKCEHIAEARSSLQRLLGIDLDITGLNAGVREDVEGEILYKALAESGLNRI